MKLLILFTFLSIGCSSPAKIFNSEHNYDQTLAKHTRVDKKYTGLSNSYQVSVTHLSSEVLNLKNKKLSFLQQWPSHRVEEASQNQETQLSESTVFILLLYTPEFKNNDLTKGKNSIWRTYLEVDGQRYPGMAAMTNLKPLQIKTLIPNMTRFSKAYEITFPIPSNESEAAKPIKFVFTSDLGTSELTF